MAEQPLVSVITPSLNMGRFIRQTIESVLGQDYPRLEYIVMDGGSSDDTLEILKSYAGRIACYSEADLGAADAVNRGFRRAHGSVLAFLNADDTYLPGAVAAAVSALESHPEAAVVYGNADWVDAAGQTLGRYPTRVFDASLLARECFICQPATFMRREALEAVGLLDSSLHYTFDYDLWIRLAREHSMILIDRVLSTSRMHADNKTVGQRRKVLEETLPMLQRHFGYIPFRWIDAYACHLVDGRDQFFQPARPSITKHALSLLIGFRYNTGYSPRFLREWASVITLAGLVRRWRGFYSGD